MEIANYRIEKEVGYGGMATVYLAIQESLERKVALKVMSPALVADPLFCKNFLREGKIVAQFNHPNIVIIHDIGVSNSNYYMAMEYVGAGSLSARIKEGISLESALNVMRQVGSALGYAHERGFIHRDVKPANILFREDGVAILTDFGIAKTIGTAGELTRMGYMVGTPHYTSPEQAAGKKADARSDLYSLGIVFHEMLTGQKPYVADDTIAVMNMHANSPLPQLPVQFAQLQQFLNKLIAKNPDDRFLTAAEMIRALEEAEAGKTRIIYPSAKTRVMPPTGKTRPYGAEQISDVRMSWFRRNKIWLGGGIIGLAMILFTGSFFFMNEQTSQQTIQPVPTQRETPLSETEREKIARLLEIAEVHIEVGRLSEPPGSNAYEAYKMVLDIDPSNQQAQIAIKEIDQLNAEQE